MENSNGQSYTQRVGASIKNTIGSMKKVNTQEILELKCNTFLRVQNPD